MSDYVTSISLFLRGEETKSEKNKHSGRYILLYFL
jgi:hypothetical protein